MFPPVKYWKLTILWEIQDYISPLWQRQTQVECKCDCWNLIRARLYSLKNWNTKSCWCSRLKFDKSTRWLQSLFRTIKQRCNNQNATWYKYYGARWIKCEWETFEDFYRDMWIDYKAGLTIERNKVNKNYCKSNCYWIPNKEQANNRSNTIKYKWKSLKKYCDENNLKYYTIWNRIKRLWWDIEKAINT